MFQGRHHVLLHSAARDAELGGDLRMTETFELVQPEDALGLRAELGQRLRQESEPLPGGHGGFGARLG